MEQRPRVARATGAERSVIMGLAAELLAVCEQQSGASAPEVVSALVMAACAMSDANGISKQSLLEAVNRSWRVEG